MSNYFVFIGEVALDEYWKCDRWPGVKDKAYVDQLEAVPGGMTANAACVAAAAGVDTRFGSALRPGPVAELLISDLRDYGVKPELIIYEPSLPDPKTMIFLVDDEHTVLIPRAQPIEISITQEQLEVMAGAEYLYTSPSDLAMMRCGELSGVGIADYCRSKGAKVAFDLDVNYHPDLTLQFMEHCDVVFLNEAGIGRIYVGVTEPSAVAEKMLASGVGIAIETLAGEGCDVYTPDGVRHTPGHKVPVVDVTGAGDTFCASFLAALSAGGDTAYAARYANAAASICVSSLGARSGASPRERVLKRMEGLD